MYSTPNNSRIRGFTLLEMLVAIAIFAILGLAANSTLGVVLKNNDVTQDFATRLQGLQQGFGMMDRDMGQIVARTPRLLSGGRGSTVIQYGEVIPNVDGKALIFYRVGWLNPDGMLPRGTIQSVAYVFTEDKLERWYFPYPDPVVGAEPIKTTIMDHVLDVSFKFYNDKEWLETVDTSKLPRGIALEVDVEGFGKIERKFLLPVGVENNNNQNGKAP